MPGVTSHVQSSDDPIQVSRIGRNFPTWAYITYVSVSVIVLALYSSSNRPIWYDEMVYFVVGGFESLSDVVAVIRDTTTNVNQGVTGAHMLLTYMSLDLLGASPIALRLPSIIFGTYMLGAAFIALRARRVGPWGVVAAPVVFAGQATLMYYVGEARTYIPLAAAIIGLLAYYSLDPATRTHWSVRALGWSAMLIGVTFHPYTAVYWPLVLVFCWIVWSHSVHQRPSARSLVRFSNPLLVTVGCSVYVLVSSLTWMRGTAPRDVDPFFFLADPLWRAITAQVLQGIYVHRELVVLVGILLIASGLLARSAISSRELMSRISPPIALIAIAWVSSALLAWISLSQDFWILPRQWVASLALAPIGFIWLVSALLESSRPRFPQISRSLGISFLFVCVWLAIAPTLQQVRNFAEASLRQPQEWSRSDLVVRLDSAELVSEDEWVAFAQANLDSGGSVWPEFARYYSDRDWTTFSLSDASG